VLTAAGTEPFDWQPLILSIKVAGAALLMVLLLATLAALGMSRRRFAGYALVEAVLMLPLVLPPVVTGYVLLLLIGRQGLIGNWLESTWGWRLIFTPYAAVLASAVVAFPLMYQSAKAGFDNIDPHLLDAARSLGANSVREFWTVVVPLTRPALVAGALLSFARALGEFGATIMVAGNIAGQTTTAPAAIYLAAEGGDLKTAGVYAAILAVVNLLFVMAVSHGTKRPERQRNL
jgi:molybdate transport system permease protein